MVGRDGRGAVGAMLAAADAQEVVVVCPSVGLPVCPFVFFGLFLFSLSLFPLFPDNRAVKLPAGGNQMIK